MAAGNNLNELKASQIWDGRSSFKTIPFEFARMLAKIAYSFSVSVFGLDGLLYICRDVILNISDDVGYLVGGYLI